MDRQSTTQCEPSANSSPLFSQCFKLLLSLLLCATMIPFTSPSSGHAAESEAAPSNDLSANLGSSLPSNAGESETGDIAGDIAEAAANDTAAEADIDLFADFDENLLANPCGSLATIAGGNLKTEGIGDSQWSSNWADWSQGSFSEWGARQYGCWVVAQARMIAACGAASTSSFNPEVYLSWEKQNGYINGNWAQVNGANAPVAYTSGRSKRLNHVSTVWSNCESQVWSNISKGYYSIISMGGNGNHFVLVDNAASSANGSIMVYESWASSTCVGTKSLSYSMQQNGMSYVAGVYTYSVSGGASGEMTAPTISTSAPAYNVGDTINAWWAATSSSTDFYQYWVIFDNMTTGEMVFSGASGADGDTGANSVNVTAPSAGRYRITVYAVPYNDKDSRQKACVAYVSVGDRSQGITRLAGNTRYDTMASIVKSNTSTADTVILASGAAFPDALSASALAGANNAPVILTEAGSLSPQALETISSLGAKHVIIMGGSAAISSSVEATLINKGISCKRVEGTTREETSIKSLSEVAASRGSAKTVIIASGSNFADSLSVSPYSYAKCAPVVLANGDGTLSEQAISAIKAAGAQRAVIVGGEAAVSNQAERSLAGAGLTVDRWAGNDRYETSAVIAEHEIAEGMTIETCAIATGENYPDALAGGAKIGRQNGILLLAADGHTSAIDKVFTPKRSRISLCTLLGGTGAVSTNLEAYVQRALNQ